MATVTAVKPQRRPGYFNIFLDGKYSFSLEEGQLLESGLRKGDEIEETRLQLLKESSHRGKIFDKLLRFAMVRPRSQQEIYNYLVYKKKIPAIEVPPLIDRLESLGYVNDESFALWWIGQRQAQKKGRQLIAQELKQKGISPEIISHVLLVTPDSEETLAQEFLFNKKRNLLRVPRDKVYQKALSFLIRRGFSYEVSRKVVVEYLAKTASL